MKGIIVSTLLVAASATAIITHYTGVVDYVNLYQSKMVPMLQQAEILEKDGRHFVIGLDITAGREGELEKDREAIGAIIRDARIKDHFEVYLIHSRAESEQEAILNIKMPASPGPAGHALVQAKRKADEAWQQCWSRVNALRKNKEKQQQTDLVGFFRYCIYQKPDFAGSKYPCLILFTDGQQTGDGYNFEKHAPTDADLIRMVKEGFMPDMSNIAVWFSGVTPTHGITNSHWRKIQTFWSTFAKSAGARSVAVSSDRILRLKDATETKVAGKKHSGSHPQTLAQLP
jgi:hypothetical protein